MKTTLRPHPPQLPFARSYWVQPGKILAGFFPGDRDPMVSELKLNNLLDCGVTHVCSLMEAQETDHAGRQFEDYRPNLLRLARGRGIKLGLLNAGIRDVSIPTIAHMAMTLNAIDEIIANRGVVYLHCWGGRGRTGTVAGCWLARHGERNPLAKLAELTAHARNHFPRVPETTEQMSFVLNWRVNQ